MMFKKASNRRSQRRPLRTESLESRQMMAGDVSVQLVGTDAKSDIYINGDYESNTVEISQEDGFLTFTGRDDTTINESPFPYVIELTRNQRRFIDDIMIDLGNGSDTLRMDDVDVGTPNLPPFRERHDLDIELGRGDNRLEMNGVYVQGHLDIDATPSFAGDNTMRLRDLQVGGDVTVRTASGDDFIQVFDSQIGDDFRVSTARGEDAVFMVGVAVSDNINADVGRGDDLIYLFDVQADDIYAVGNNGDDGIVMTDVQANDMIRADGGKGDDTVALRDAQSDRLVLYTGYGEDLLMVSSTVTRRFWIDTGYGDDTAEIDDLFAQFGTLRGGYGVDVLFLSHQIAVEEARMEGSQTGFDTVV